LSEKPEVRAFTSTSGFSSGNVFRASSSAAFDLVLVALLDAVKQGAVSFLSASGGIVEMGIVARFMIDVTPGVAATRAHPIAPVLALADI
jgi:hypothetical protein